MYYKKILVPIDGSILADLAYQKAKVYALDHDAKIIVLSVLDINVPLNPEGGVVDFNAFQPIINNTKDLLKDYQNDGGNLVESTVFEIGNVKKTILSKIDELNVDAVFMGASGTNSLTRLLVGSTTAFIIKKAPVDVLVVRTFDDNKTRPTH